MAAELWQGVKGTGGDLGVAGTGGRAHCSRSAESSGRSVCGDCWRGSDYDTDAKEEREEAKQEEGPVTNGHVRVAPSLPAGSRGEDAKEDRMSAREGSTQPAKAAPMCTMAMQVGETASLK